MATDMSRRNCHACAQALGFGTMVKAAEREWHQQCFACFECRNLIQGEFHIRQGNDGRTELLCRDCEERLRQQAIASAPVCAGCGNRIISGQVLGVQGVTFHPNCFKCSQCQILIQGGACQIGNQFVCQACAMKPRGQAPPSAQASHVSQYGSPASNQYGGPPSAGAGGAPRSGGAGGVGGVGGAGADYCAGCAQPITEGRSVRTGGKVYHVDCLNCTRCYCNLATGAAIASLEGMPYCTTCVDALGAEKRASQASGVAGAGNAYGRSPASATSQPGSQSPYGVNKQPGGPAAAASSAPKFGDLHCNGCNSAIQGEYLTKDGKQYCRNCSAQQHQMGGLQNTPCSTCGKPLGIGSYKQAQDNFYHPNCFVCYHCRGVIEANFKKHTKIPDPNIYCVSCFDDLFAKKCEKCRLPITGEAVRLEKKIEYEEEVGPSPSAAPVVPPSLPPRDHGSGAGRAGGAGAGAGGAGAGAGVGAGAGAGGRGGFGGRGGGRGGAAAAAGAGSGGAKAKDTHWTMKGSKWVRTDGKLSTDGQYVPSSKESYATRCHVTLGASNPRTSAVVSGHTSAPVYEEESYSSPSSSNAPAPSLPPRGQGSAGEAGGPGYSAGAANGQGNRASVAAGAGAGAGGGQPGSLQNVQESVSASGMRKRTEIREVFYHVHCFTCAGCGVEFGGGVFYMTEDDQPHCQPCITELEKRMGRLQM